MKTLVLNDELFWEWISSYDNLPDKGINTYLKALSANISGTDFISELLDYVDDQKTSSIMDNLSFGMPRKYFLEIQFCASTYARIFGTIFPPLASQVDQLAYIEWLLYTEPGYRGYRDHLVHMFKVAFVCDHLMAVRKLSDKLVKWQFESQHFLRWCKNRRIAINKWMQTEKDEVARIAIFLAAIFHDFGYGYFFLRRYKERLFKLYEWLLPGGDPTDIDSPSTQIILKSLPAFFVQDHHDWLSDVNAIITDNVVTGFFHDSLPLNHSTSSSLFVLDVTEKLFKARALSEKLYVAFQLAAEAVMIHDMTGDNSWVHLKTKNNMHFLNCNEHKSVPLAMLLILADELSVWNRATLQMVSRGQDEVGYQFNTQDVPDKIEVRVTERKKQNRIEIKPNRGQENIKRTFYNNLKCLKNNSNQNRSKILEYSISVIS